MFSGSCLLIAFAGFIFQGPYLVENSKHVVIFRRPWPVIMAANALLLYVIWLCVEMFIYALPFWLCLLASLFFFLCLAYPAVTRFGVPETIRFDLEEGICTYTHGWFRTASRINKQDIVGLVLSTAINDGGKSYTCRLEWNKNFFGWSEIGSFGEYDVALAFMQDLSQKTQLPLTVK